jgi:hypothetical protein
MKNSSLGKLRNVFRYGDRMRPVRDWFVLLAISIMTLGVAVVWNAWLFDDVASGGTLLDAATSTPAAFSKSSLQSVEQIFQERAAEDATFASTTSNFTDPSI